jgi:hypothetical protein
MMDHVLKGASGVVVKVEDVDGEGLWRVVGEQLSPAPLFFGVVVTSAGRPFCKDKAAVRLCRELELFFESLPGVFAGSAPRIGDSGGGSRG